VTFFPYQVVTKKNPACHVNDLAEAESGSKVSNAGDELLTAINMKVCSTNMANASPMKAQEAHNNGIFPLPL